VALSDTTCQNILDNNKTNGTLETLLNQEIAFQRKWKRLTMTAYVITTFGTIISTTSATICAALNRSIDAAILAATATVFISVEKSMMFREKWRLHLTIYTRLRNLQRSVTLKAIDEQTALAKMGSILEEYSAELPIAQRES
jgi:hypothetical protein